ncbi:basic helix-loop-helix protein [Basidiobolus ranarum]|uniref:Basic helix-loop-helix protein n=1 Tax=Basidiobolus ranarum TaxID=34480 RepID=A0ABR2W5P0_9FUNG
MSGNGTTLELHHQDLKEASQASQNHLQNQVLSQQQWSSELSHQAVSQQVLAHQALMASSVSANGKNDMMESNAVDMSKPKPPVGSEEWHRLRRESHKEVERRRRETINEGINEIAKLVPGCEKNKGSILSRAVQYIQQLKENESTNIEKWTLEKLLTDQAINELSNQVEMLKEENEQLRAQLEELSPSNKKARKD